MQKDLMDSFYLYSDVNNTFVQTDFKGNRLAVENILQAKRFNSEKDVTLYIDSMMEDGKEFLNFYKVIRGSEHVDNFLDTTSWPHYSLKDFQEICKKLGVKNQNYFRGRLAHLVALLKVNDEDEFRLEMVGVRSDDQETTYPSKGFSS